MIKYYPGKRSIKLTDKTLTNQDLLNNSQIEGGCQKINECYIVNFLTNKKSEKKISKAFEDILRSFIKDKTGQNYK